MNDQAEIEKEKGNDAYKKQDYSTAVKHYDKAIEINSSNITYYTNKAAVLLELNKLEECIKVCLEGIDVGRKHNADSQALAKAYARIGNAYCKQNNYKDAKVYYGKSLEEYVEPAILQRHDEMIHLSESNNDYKRLGDHYYNKGEYSKAVGFYTEAIRKCPTEAKVYGNRAQCYMKMGDFHSALRDSEECIKFDPNFIKGHLRKGYACLELKEYNCALIAFKNALKIDNNCKEAVDGYQSACNSICNRSANDSRYSNHNDDQDLLKTLSEQFDKGLESLDQHSQRAWQSLTRNGSKLKKIFTPGASRSQKP